MGMPAQRKGQSKQDYGTPPALIAAIERRFGVITWDAAADATNAVCSRYFSKSGTDALTADWSAHFPREQRDLVFLNPEFGGLGALWAPLVDRWTRRLPWLRVLMLSPASVGSEWFQQYVNRRAMVLALSPRLHFVGASDPYPKDCMLSCFGFGLVGFDVWRWDEDPSAPAPVKARPGAKRLTAAAP